MESVVLITGVYILTLVPDSVPLSVLLATDSGVSILSKDTIYPTIIINHTSAVTNVDFNFLEDEIFYISDDKIWSIQYSTIFNKYSKPTSFKVPEYSVHCITVDWRNSLLYMGGMAMLTSRHIQQLIHVLYEKDPSAEERTNILELTDAIQEIKVDPYNRLVFYLENGILNSYGIDSKEIKTYDNTIAQIKQVSKLALDISLEVIYLIGIDESDIGHLMEMGYKDSQMKALYSNAELAKPFGLDFFRDTIVWGNQDGGRYTLYTCQLSTRCQQEDIRQIYQQTEPIYDIKIYHRDIQIPSLTQYQCSKLKCSHKCSSDSLDNLYCSCPERMTIGDDKKTCEPFPKSTLNVTYVGCYSTYHADSSLYKAQHSLSWEECVAFCDNRMTRYVGVQEEYSGSRYNVPYCTNSLDERFQLVDSSVCRPCTEDTERYCGGYKIKAVYQLRDSSNLAVLLATDRGVSMFSSDTSSTSIRINHTSPVNHVDFYYLEDKIIFISDDIVLSSEYNPFSKKYYDPAIPEIPHYAQGLAVDWVNRNIYFAVLYGNYDDYSETYEQVYKLYQTDLSAEGWEEILELNGTTQDMAVDPYNRLVFFIQNGILQCYDLENRIRKEFINEQSYLKKVTKFALDVIQETIYLIGVDESDTFILITIDYEDSIVRRLYNGPKLINPFDLDVYGDKIVWGNQNGDLYTLYTCQLSPICWQDDIKQVYQQTWPIYDIKIYQPDIQTPNLTKLSSKRKCSVVSQSTIQCSCPEGMATRADDKTCENINSITSSTIITSIELKEVDTTEAVITSTIETERLEPQWTFTTEETPSEFLPVTVFSDTEHSDHGYTETSTESTNTKDEAEIENKSPKSSTNILEMLIITGVIIFVALFVGLIYFRKRQKRPEGHFSIAYEAASEIKVQ